MPMSNWWRWWLRFWLFVRWIPSAYRKGLGELRPRPLELLGALWAITWGVWVGNPIWDVFPSSPTFRVLGLVAPESVWGIIVAGVGSAALLAVYVDNLLWRYRVSAAAFLLWSFITLLFIISNPSSTATITYGMMAIMSGLVMGKLKERIPE